MSFHGGLLGVLIALLWAAKKFKFKFLAFSDLIVAIAPLGLFFGRIGNFINGELYGRIADSFCLHFPTDPNNCRYPSQLIQAGLEGLLLFIIMQVVLKKSRTTGVPSAVFLVLYGIFRIMAEFFRQPDPQIGFLPGGITEGQLLSIFMIIAGIVLFVILKKKTK
jgi:phosphatidylglycerol:prolipoprotein diacylglycerol transferase